MSKKKLEQPKNTPAKNLLSLLEEKVPETSEQVDLIKKIVTGHAEDLAKVLGETKKDITSFLEDIPDDLDLSTDEGIESLISMIGDRYDVLDDDVQGWAEGLVGDIVEQTRPLALDKAGIEAASSTFSDGEFSKKYLDGYLKYLSPDKDESLVATQTDKMYKSDIRDIRSMVMDTMRKAPLEGMTPSDINSSLRQQLKDKGKDLDTWRFVDNSGKKWAPGNYFSMLVRTLTVGVSRDTFADTLSSEGFDLARVVNGGAPCPVCKEWDGRILSISGNDKHYPSMQDAKDAGVWHPNCVCYIEYVDEEVDKTDLEDQADGDIPKEEETTPPEHSDVSDEGDLLVKAGEELS